eukprot:gb/GECG01004478.1/.p1 GENE.gb/GECG01004478.1/~~gb/GECG01004478.1/.p1  ORF type:complete len:443 (+),score=34.93 gb/GECG01004478.1/:1-1329(+)
MWRGPRLKYRPGLSTLSTLLTVPIGIAVFSFWCWVIILSSIVRKLTIWTRPLWGSAAWAHVLPSAVVQLLEKIWLSQFKASDLVGHKIGSSTDDVPGFLKDPGLGRHRWMTTSDDVSLHYVMKGPSMDSSVNSYGGQGRKLLLCLHGFPEFWYGMKPFLEHFSQDFTVVALDMRGYGESGKPKANWFNSSNYRIDRLTQDVNEVIEHLGFSKAYIAAHDWGGCVAWMFAHEYAQKVEKMVVMAGPHPKAFFSNLTLRQVMKSWYMFLFQVPVVSLILLKRDEAYGLAWQPFQGMLNGMINENQFTLQDLEAYTWNACQEGFPISSISYYRSATRGDLMLMAESEFPQITAEILLLIPFEDGCLETSTFEGIERFCKKLEVKYLSHCSHWVLFDARDKVLKECSLFFGNRIALKEQDNPDQIAVSSRLEELLNNTDKYSRKCN